MLYNKLSFNLLINIFPLKLLKIIYDNLKQNNF